MDFPSQRKIILFAGTLALIFLLAGPNESVLGQGQGYSEKEAQSIDRMLMCPVCPAESIDQAQVEISRQMKAIVREMLGQGATRDEILDFFVARYGTEVLAAPPKSGVNLLAWVLPIVGVLAALAGGVLVIRAMTTRHNGQLTPATVSQSDPDDPGLDPFLEAVDRELGLQGLTSVEGVAPPGEATGASDLDGEGVDGVRDQETNHEEDLGQNG